MGHQSEDFDFALSRFALCRQKDAVGLVNFFCIHYICNQKTQDYGKNTFGISTQW